VSNKVLQYTLTPEQVATTSDLLRTDGINFTLPAGTITKATALGEVRLAYAYDQEQSSLTVTILHHPFGCEGRVVDSINKWFGATHG
jgi:hypothetical protein